MSTFKAQWKPDFIEEAVFVTIHYHDEMGDNKLVSNFHKQKDFIYEEAPLSERNERFQKFYANQFVTLGVRDFFLNLFNEFPYLQDSDLKIICRRAWSRKEEGTEMYVHDGMKNVLVKLQIERIRDLAELATFLRHELLHISDMLDPAFEYLPQPEIGGANEVEDNLMRDRFAILWDLYVTLRIDKRGQNILIPFDKQKAKLEKAFASWQPEQRKRIFEDIRSGRAWTQKAFLDVAKGISVASGDRQVAEKCYLCEFPNLDSVTHWTEPDAKHIMAAIRKDRPDWAPRFNTCQQCYEIYRSQIKVGLIP